MKKILILAVIAMMSTVTVNAQEGYEDTKHEVAVSYGLLSTSNWLDVFENVVTVSVAGAEYDNEKFIGPIGVEYFYRANKWLGVGGVFTYGCSKKDIMFSGQKDGTYKNTYMTVMPAVKFDWLRKSKWGMYSKLGVGATFRTEKTEIKDGKDTNENATHFNWQASLIGVEVGSPYLRGFFELGMGEQGTVLAGVRCKF